MERSRDDGAEALGTIVKTKLITFSGGVYNHTTRLIIENGQKCSADFIWVYDDLWLTKQPFYELNSWLWTHPHKRGFGWYAWKPFIIWDSIRRSVFDDMIVMYTDADCYPVADLRPLFEICERDGLMIFEDTPFQNVNLCKRDCYVVMGQDCGEYHDRKAGLARYCLFKKGDWKAEQFLMEWLTYSVNPLANTFDPSVLQPELDGFKEHRCEQSVLTLLAHKYGLYLWRSLCESGERSTKDREHYGKLMSQDNSWNRINGGRNLQAPLTGSKYANVT